MSDRTDARMKAFVSELVADPPQPPTFPRPDLVVVGAEHATGDDTMTDTKTRTNPKSSKSMGPLVAAAAFVAIALVGGAVLLVNAGGDDVPAASEPAAATTVVEATVQITDVSAIVGTKAVVVDAPTSASPTAVEFGADGTYRVTEFGLGLDSGTYTAEGETVTFVSSPSDDVLWASNNEMLRPRVTCDHIVGEYTATFDSDNLMTLTVVSDACSPRLVAANGTVMRLAE
ncbi:MAG: hypothetical protein ACR2N7_00950 [Acidimicrobiia bacterium]